MTNNKGISWLKTRWEAPSTRIVLTVVVFVAVFCGLWWIVDAFNLWPKIELLPRLLPLLFGSLFLFLLILIVWQFTKPLPGVEKGTSADSSIADPWLNQENVRARRYWMTLSYSFMILALAAAVVPFSIDLRKDPGDPGWDKQHYARTDSPISVFRGCVADNNYRDSTLRCYGDEDQDSKTAGIPRLSWIVQVGGYVTPFPIESESIEFVNQFVQKKQKLEQIVINNEKARQQVLGAITYKQLQDSKKKTQAALAKQKKEIEQTEQELAQLKKNTAPTEHNQAPASTNEIAALEKELSRALATLKTMRDKETEIVQLEQSVAENTTAIEEAQNELEWLLYIRDRHARGDSGYLVQGGLVIPFYLIILSLIGGGVSLTRRIPEYQKQSTRGYVGTQSAPLLTPAQLREYLVFQIIQFISAPFIATVAYYVIAPSTTAATVGLAFAAGFASETVLLWVRAVVVKLRPEGAKDKPTGSLTGVISSLTGSVSEEATKNGATVSIIGHGELVPIYSSHGQFAVNGIPEGEYALEIKLANSQTCTQRVHIQAGQTVPVWVECA